MKEIQAGSAVLALDGLGCTEELLEAIRNWEHLRGRNAFPEELQVCDLLEMQPGQPGDLTGDMKRGAL